MPDDGVRLFVYGISASCPRDLLEDKFGKCGRVNDVYNTGKGFAFVTMEDDRGAQDAIDELHGTTIDGQEVKVEISKPRDRSGGGGGGRDRRGGGGGYGGGGGRDRYGGGGGGGRDGGRSYGGGGGRDGGRDGGRRGGGGGRRDDDRGSGGDRRDRDRSYNRRDDY